MADVTFQHPQYQDRLTRWQKIDDVLSGQEAVKAAKETYLPKNNPSDISPENTERYDNYLKRAFFLGIAKRTWNALVGMAFRKEPVLVVPASLEYVDTDIDGNGVSIYQQSQAVLGNVLAKGRAGILVDYPRTAGNTSRFDMISGFIRASIAWYTEKTIINWRTRKVGGKFLLSLVVLSEKEDTIGEDGFSFTSEDIYRVLRLVDMPETAAMGAGPVSGSSAPVPMVTAYVQEIYRKAKDGKDAGKFVVSQVYVPKQGNGSPWPYIPFYFIGSIDNDENCDSEPLNELVDINLAHYLNSAEYEDSAFWCGQPQPVISGLTEAWRDHMEKNGVYIGSSKPITLPVGGDFKFAQVEPNTLAKEAMDSKLDQAAKMGARLLEKGSAQTATEVRDNADNETSQLALIASNVSEAYTQALGDMAIFNNIPTTDDLEYSINQDFVDHNLDPSALREIFAGVQAGRIPESDFWDYLRKYGVIAEDKTDEEIKDEIENQLGAAGAGNGLDLDNEPPPNEDQDPQE